MCPPLLAQVLNLTCTECGKPCRTQTEQDLHTKRTGHASFVDKVITCLLPFPRPPLCCVPIPSYRFVACLCVWSTVCSQSMVPCTHSASSNALLEIARPQVPSLAPFCTALNSPVPCLLPFRTAACLWCAVLPPRAELPPAAPRRPTRRWPWTRRWR